VASCEFRMRLKTFALGCSWDFGHVANDAWLRVFGFKCSLAFWLSTIGLGPKTNLEPKTIDLGHKTINLGPKTIGLRPKTFVLRVGKISLGPMTIGLRPKTSVLGPGTI
jgi:hypothetical protein